jgi:phospholipid transport system transporter-binding protein
MSQSYSINVDPASSIIHVSGDLTFATVGRVLDQMEKLPAGMGKLNFDLIKVKHSDSAGLALLVHWMRQANNENRQIMFSNVPKQLLAIASASGLEELLPLQ